MVRWIVVLVLAGVSYASVTQFTWQDCDSDPNRAIKVSSISVGPMPIIMPGPLTVSFKGNVTRAIQSAKIELDLRRHVAILGDVYVPCLFGVGSCSVPYCSALDGLLKDSDAATRKVGEQIQTMLTANHINADCPVQAQSASVTNAHFDLPDIGSIASVIAAGDYTIKATIRDNTNAVVGCVSFKVELKRKSTGFLFG